MPVTYVPSAEQLVARQKTTARKRRRNQNTEIQELGALLPFPDTSGSSLDKISVLRLSSAYLKFRSLVETAYGSTSASGGNGFTNELLSKAIDGFLLVLDDEANVLYTSETITEYVGLSQQDVIGQSLYDLTHPEDTKVIGEKLQPKGTTLSQHRQFYVRFKSTVSPGRMQLSKFTSHIMVQVSGNLKMSEPLQVQGLVAECRLIESSSSILELSIPQAYFTSTVSLDKKILSVDTKVKELIGFDADDFVGTRLADYFHPADHTNCIPCHNLLMRTGHAVSPVFRFMTSSGEWVWVQLDGLVRYKEGTNEPQYIEVKVKIVSAYNGKLKFIEQKELYGNCAIEDSAQAKNPHRDAYFLDQLPETPIPQTPEPIVKSLESANLSPLAVDTILHSRELGLYQMPQNIKRLRPPTNRSPMQVQPPLLLSRPARIPSTSPPSAQSSPPASIVSALSPPSSATASSPPSSVQSAAPSPLSMPSPEQTVQYYNSPSETDSAYVPSPQMDYSSGQSVVSPPSVGFNTQVSPVTWPVKSPPSVQSPDSGIGMHSNVSSPPSVFTLSPQNGSMANGGQEIYNENVIGFGVSTTHAQNSTPAQNSTHSSIPGLTFHPGSFQFATLPQSSNPHTFQQPQPPMFSQALPSRPLATMPSSATGSSTTDPVLTQLLQEAVALNSFSNTGFPAATNTQELLNEFPGTAPSTAQKSHDLASKTAITTTGTVSMLPVIHANLQNSEVQEILQQFLP